MLYTREVFLQTVFYEICEMLGGILITATMFNIYGIHN